MIVDSLYCYIIVFVEFSKNKYINLCLVLINEIENEFRVIKKAGVTFINGVLTHT